MQVAIGNKNLTLTIHSGQTVNGISTEYAIANMFILAATLAANTWAIRVILRKEKIRINKLIIWDCFVNMATMALLTHIWKKALHHFSAVIVLKPKNTVPKNLKLHWMKFCLLFCLPFSDYASTFAYSPLLPLSSYIPCSFLVFAMCTTLTWSHSF